MGERLGRQVGRQTWAGVWVGRWGGSGQGLAFQVIHPKQKEGRRGGPLPPPFPPLRGEGVGGALTEGERKLN